MEINHDHIMNPGAGINTWFRTGKVWELHLELKNDKRG